MLNDVIVVPKKQELVRRRTCRPKRIPIEDRRCPMAGCRGNPSTSYLWWPFEAMQLPRAVHPGSDVTYYILIKVIKQNMKTLGKGVIEGAYVVPTARIETLCRWDALLIKALMIDREIKELRQL